MSVSLSLLLLCLAAPSVAQETQIRYGTVVKLEMEPRVLTMVNQSGGSILQVKIAEDVEFRRLDDGPKELSALKQGDRVRVEYEDVPSGLPVATSILARSAE